MADSVEIITVFNILPEIIARLPGALDDILSQGAEDIAQYAIANHPWQNESGETEASIHSEQTGDHEYSAVAGGAMQFLEFGTVHMPPFPTMQPAYDAVYPTIESNLSDLESHLL
jgi:HK97 gp10 family phage protein